MRVGHNRRTGVLMVIGGVLCVALGVLGLLRVPDPTIGHYGPLLAGAVCGVAGLAMQTRPALELTEHAVIVYALLGPARRTYPFATRGELRIADGALWLGARKLMREKVCDPRDWAELRAALAFA